MMTIQVLCTFEKVVFILKLNALSCGNIVETTVIMLNLVALKKADLCHLERAGSLVKDKGIVIHKIGSVKPEPPELFSYSVISHGKPRSCRRECSHMNEV